MERKNIINISLGVVAVLVLVVFAFFVNVSSAAESVAVLRTFGMTCGSCSEKIVNALQKEEGVASVAVDVEGGQVVVNFDPKKVAPERLAAKVTATGYGSSVLNVLTKEEYRALTGKTPGPPAGRGCPNKCC